MTVQGDIDIGSRLQHRGVDRVPRLVVGVVSINDVTVEINLDQVAGADFVKQQPIRIDQVVLRMIRHPGA